MRYSLLEYLRCPACRGELACFVAHEAATEISPIVAERASRAPAAGHAFAAATSTATTPLASRLRSLAGPAAPERNRQAEVDRGLLICGDCARWFPIDGTLPELLPDHLRDDARDAALLETLAAGLPADIRPLLRRPGTAAAADDAGAHYKRSEIGIVAKIEDTVGFFGPGYSSPFNPGNTEFTLYLIKLFANVITLLDLKKGAVVVDSGSGYSWTTEWLGKSGVEAIGLDICRAYLEIGVRRMGPSRPHLVVADVENLPVADGCADAVLAYESFHHVPDRVRAMAGFARALKNGAPIVLAEPGAAHEDADVSVATMDKFGILEKGMELDDLDTYVEGSPFDPPEQHYILRASTDDLERGIHLPSAWRHAIFHTNVFRIRKNASVTARRSFTGGARVPVGRDTPPAGAASNNAPDDLRRTHERLTREWQAELQRTATELRTTTSDLEVARSTVADMQRSAFWKARRVWVNLAAMFGSKR